MDKLVDLSPEDKSSLQSLSRQASIVIIGGFFVLLTGISLIIFAEWTFGESMIINIAGAIGLIGGSVLKYIMQKALRAGTKRLISNTVDRLEIKRAGSTFEYEVTGANVLIKEKKPNGFTDSSEPIILPPGQKDLRGYHVWINEESFKVERPFFFGLKEGDQIQLEILTGGKVLKASKI